MATAWGYKNGVVIKKLYSEGVMFLHADSISETNLDKLIISATVNSDMTTGYEAGEVSWDRLPVICKAKGYHWLNHHVKKGYRNEENCIPGFNLIVLDVDGGCSLSTAKMLLKKYKAIYYTTKRHTEAENRFRIILPINYTVPLDAADFKEMYNNILSDLPFDVDAQCGQRSKKWLSNPDAEVFQTDGELFDILPYLPKTTKNEERQERFKNQSDMDNLERWVINNTGDGNRNNMLLRFAMILMDAGFNFENIKDKTINLNDKLPDKLSEVELSRSIFHTTAQRLAEAGRL